MEEISIRGARVKYEKNAKNGINHLLYDLDAPESKVFFDQARDKKRAEFEDDTEGQYTLSYNSDRTYTLSRR